MTTCKRLEVLDSRTGLLILTTGLPRGLTLDRCKRLALTAALEAAAQDWPWDDAPDGPPSLSELEVREVGATVVCEGEAA